MPHAAYTRDLGRNRSWRAATVRSLAQALIQRERIHTTLAKAKEAQRFTERLITLGKAGTLSARRRAIQLLPDQQTIRRLFTEVAPRFEKRSGGYTRILHEGNRPGDGAFMAMIELVELGARFKTGPKPKGQAAEKPKVQKPPVEKPHVEKPKVERPKVEEPKEPRKETPKKAKEEPKQKKPEPGFLDNVRKFFKRRDNP